ncbi:MAG: hypothetical protein HYY05_06550 [Chloroflexi bacterium]|nr:hypothetical protein [Chloroflexota bacterium]
MMELDGSVGSKGLSRTPDDERTLTIKLTPVEVIYLTDSIANSDVDQGDVESPTRLQALARPLLLKLGSAYCELVGPSGYDATGTATISITEREAWLLRGKVQTGSMGIDKSVIGVALLRKLYSLLLEFNAQSVTDEFVIVTTAAGKDANFGDEERRALEEFDRRERHASTKPADTDEDDGAGEDAGAQKGAQDQAGPDLPRSEGQGDSPSGATPPIDAK